MKINFWFVFINIVFINNMMTQVDSLKAKQSPQLYDSLFYMMDEIQVIAPSDIQFTKRNNTYDFDVAGTYIEKQPTLLQSIKLLPQLSISDNEIKFANQKCIIEIDDNMLDLSPSEIIDLLNGIDPSNVSKILITTNSYKYGYKCTVINIKMRQLNRGYRSVLSTTHGSRYNYYNENSANFNFHSNNIQNLSSLLYSYVPYYYSGNIAYNTPIQQYVTQYNEKNSNKNFVGYNQFQWNISEKWTWRVNGYYSNRLLNNNSFVHVDTLLLRKTDIKNNNNSVYVDNVVQVKITDSSQIKTSVLYFNSNQKAGNQEIFLGNNGKQTIASNVPYIRARVEWSLMKSKFNLYSGVRVYEVQSKSISNWNNQHSVFNYKEQSINGFFILETKFKNTNFNINVSDEYINLSNKLSLNDSASVFNYQLHIPLVNVNLNWQSKNKWDHSISINNDLLKPDYANFNSIKSIDNQMYYSVGSQNMKPSKAYQLNYSLNNQHLFLSFNLNYVKNYISNMIEYNASENLLLTTYKNFDEIKSADLSVSYNKEILPNLFYIKWNNLLSYFNLKDKLYNIHPTTPLFNSSLEQIWLLNKLQIGLNYYMTTDFYDGLIYHFFSHHLNVIVAYTISSSFKAFIEINDPLKTNKQNQYKTTLPNYLYQSNIYYDYRFFNFSLKYYIQSSKYKKNNIDKSIDEEVKRFN